MLPNESSMLSNIKKEISVELCPEPVSCSERNCKEPPFVAYWPKNTKQFKFACIEHKICVDNQQNVVLDKIEDYVKLKRRKMYTRNYQEYLK